MTQGVSDTQIGLQHSKRQSPPGVLFAGRSLHWKSIDITLKALSYVATNCPMSEWRLSAAVLHKST